MSRCPNNHPNEDGASFCTVCGVAIAPATVEASRMGPGAPPPPVYSTAAAPVPPYVSPNPSRKTNSALIVSVVATSVLVIAGVFVWGLGGLSKPSIDFDNPSTIVMRAYDFPFDMALESDRTAFLDQGYPIFGSDCRQNQEMLDLLDNARAPAEVQYYAGDSLKQYVYFRQVVLRFPSEREANDFVDTVRQGARSDACAWSSETISETHYGVTTVSDVYGYEVSNSVVFNSDTVYDAKNVLEATVRGLFVIVAQDNFVLVLEGNFDSTSPGVDNSEMRAAIKLAVEKAFGDY